MALSKVGGLSFGNVLTKSAPCSAVGGIRRAYSAHVDHAVSEPSIDLFDAKSTYGDIPTFQLMRSIAVLKATQIKPLVEYGPLMFNAVQKVPILRTVANEVAKRTFFRQFCGGETLDECRTFVERLQKKGVYCIFDYSAEAHPGDENVHASDKYAASAAIVGDTIRWSSENNVPGFSCVKISALARFSLLEKITERIYDGDMNRNLPSHVSELGRGGLPGLSSAEMEEVYNSLSLLDKLCDSAKSNAVPMLIDAEQFSVQGAIDLFAMAMQRKHNHNCANVYTTIQAYLKNAESRVSLLRSMGKDLDFVYGVKQVRGAYMVSERQRAMQLGYESPICNSAEDTHNNYDNLASTVLEDVQGNRGSVMFATHNSKSLKYIAHECARLGIDRSSPNLHIAQLYGMGDSLTIGMVNAGYNAAKYVPFGPIEEVMPYLTRRLQENNDALSGAPRDIKMFVQVLRERDLLPYF